MATAPFNNFYTKTFPPTITFLILISSSNNNKSAS